VGVKSTGKSKTRSDVLKRYFWILAAMWILVVAASLAWNLWDERDTAHEVALAQAQATHDKDLSYRRWSTEHGGVYVPVTEQTPPNPYLDVPNREITTDSGDVFTLINPAYMTRQVYDLAQEQYGFRGHITSLNPLNPANTPDPWEEYVLRNLDVGQKDFSAVQIIDGDQYMRLLIPMIAEPGCIKCHQNEGYIIGAPAGGISVSIPIELRWGHMLPILVGHGALLLLGLTGVGFFGGRLITSVRERELVENEREALFQERGASIEQLNVHLAALDAAAEIVVITDDKGAIEYVNESFTSQTGYSYDEVIGENPRLLKSGKQSNAFYQDLWGTISANKVWRGNLINLRKDGTEYPEEMTITPLVGDNGQVARHIAIKRDISERLRTQAEIDAAQILESENSKLQQINEARSEFLSTVSHELRTPLTSMISFSDIVRRNREGNLSERQMDQLGHISDGGHRLNALIDDLLDVSRSETGHFELELMPFDIGKLLQEVSISSKSIFDEREQSLEVVNLDTTVQIHGDRVRIAQALGNLLTNASKYSGDSAVTTLTVTIESDMVRIEVRDQGIGISASDQVNMFIPFFRANNADTRKESGTGLGLVIAKTIVESHGGRVTLESEEGAGTTVRIYLPKLSENPES
jgi:two-component system, chemotaxis family, sensor kinase Cph1